MDNCLRPSCGPGAESLRELLSCNSDDEEKGGLVIASGQYLIVKNDKHSFVI